MLLVDDWVVVDEVALWSAGFCSVATAFESGVGCVEGWAELGCCALCAFCALMSGLAAAVLDCALVSGVGFAAAGGFAA